MQRVGRILSAIYLAVFIAGAVTLAVFSLPFTGLKALNIATGSMQPHMPPGTLVIVHRVPLSDIKTGDVITFANPNNIKTNITHRVKETKLINGTVPAFVTQGDANAVPDGTIVGGLVKGKVITALPIVGKLVMFLKTWTGIILLVYLPAAVIILSEMWRLKRFYERQQVHYTFAGYGGHSQGVTAMSRVGDTVKFAAVIFVFTLAGMLVPVRALLGSQVQLTNNIIATNGTVPTPQQPHVVFKEVWLRCSTSNTSTTVSRPVIFLYNQSNANLNLKGWSIRDNSGTLYTFGNHSMVRHGVIAVRPLLATSGLNGLQIAGDRLVIYDAASNKVDGLSWGTDISQLNPSIMGVTIGDRLIRADRSSDTDKATDWRVNAIRCGTESHSAPHADTQESPDESDASYGTDDPSLLPTTTNTVTISDVE